MFDNEEDICKEVIKDLISIPAKEIEPLYVITNASRTYGSNALLYKDEVLKKLADKLDSDLYIIPSSIYELLVLPVNRGINADQIAEMIKHVNENDVKAAERLSGSVYFYSRKNNEVSIAKKERLYI